MQSNNSPPFGISSKTVTQSRFPNGLSVYTFEQASAPTVTLRGITFAGSVLDGPYPGLAQLMVTVMNEGSAFRAFVDIQRQLDAVGASMTVDCRWDHVSFQSSALAQDFGLVADALAELLITPSYSATSIDRAKRRLAMLARQFQTDPSDLAKGAFMRSVYPEDHPLHHVFGLPGLLQIDEAILREFHDQYFQPDRTVIVVVGAIKEAAVLQELSRSFGAWPVSQQRPLLPEVPLFAAQGRRVVAPVKAAEYAHVVIGVPGFTYQDPHYYGGMLAHLILGQMGVMGRLGERLRLHDGLIYHLRSEIHPGFIPGPWWIRCQVSRDQTERVVRTIFEEITEFQARGPTTEDLVAARNSVLNSLIVRLEGNDSRARRILDTAVYGLGLDHLADYAAELERLSLSDVATAVRELFPLERCTVVTTT